MTQFNKSDFSYHGGYLMYRGDYEGRPVYPNKEGVHPSNVGRGIDLFIARFKYSGSPIKMSIDLFIARFKYSGSPIKMGAFKKFLIKNFTVEEYVAARNSEGLDSSPLRILQSKGFA